MRRPHLMLYAEDFAVGDRWQLATHTVTADAIVAFASAWDPLTIHTDEGAALAGPFNGLIASGVHTMAIGVRLLVDELASRTAIVAGREVRSLKMRKPVRPGTTITGTVEILEQRLRPDGRGVIVWRIDLTDDDGDLVLTMTSELLVQGRNRSPADG